MSERTPSSYPRPDARHPPTPGFRPIMSFCEEHRTRGAGSPRSSASPGVPPGAGAGKAAEGTSGPCLARSAQCAPQPSSACEFPLGCAPPPSCSSAPALASAPPSLCGSAGLGHRLGLGHALGHAHGDSDSDSAALHARRPYTLGDVAMVAQQESSTAVLGSLPPFALARTKLQLSKLPAVDMENDRLARACGQDPLLGPVIRDTASSSTSHHPPASHSSDSLNPSKTSGTRTPGVPGLNVQDDPLLDVPLALAWGLRPRATSVRVPQRHSPHAPARPRSASQPASIPVFAPASPRGVLRSLRDVLEEEGVGLGLEECVDVQAVFGRWEAAREGKGRGTFGSPVGAALRCASMSTVLGGYQLHVPWVVYACVEELNRTGIYQSGLFRSVPNRTRLARLIETFDTCAPSSAESPHTDEMCPRMTPTLSTTRASLRKESMPDICALLKNYLEMLPEPLLDANLTAALHTLCVQPSLASEDDADAAGSDGGYFAAHIRARSAPPLPAHAHLPPDVPMTPSEYRSSQLSLEAPQILLAQHILRLAPPPSLALLAYLLAFFTQLPLCPDNGMGFADVARMFGRVLVGGPGADVGVVRECVHWLLERWARVSDGLFDVAAGSEDGHAESAPATACRATFEAFSLPSSPSASENTPREAQVEREEGEGEIGLARMQIPYDPGLRERGYRSHSTSVSSQASSSTSASVESEEVYYLDAPYASTNLKAETDVEVSQVEEYDVFDRSVRIVRDFTLVDREYVSCPPSPRHYARAAFDEPEAVDALYSPPPSVRSLDIESTWECYSGATSRYSPSPSDEAHVTSLRWAKAYSADESYSDSDCESCYGGYGGANEGTPRNSASFRSPSG